MMGPSEQERAIAQLAALISRSKIAMLTTVTEEGALRSRPVTTQGTRFDGDLWFFTRIGSTKVDDVQQDRRVGLTYSTPSDNAYISLSGTARVIIDPAKSSELWDPSYQTWFPGGPSDPDLALIHVSVEHAEYWTAPALTWPLSAGFVTMAPENRDNPEFHARIVLDRRSGS
jgi:general stress protein 26